MRRRTIHLTEQDVDAILRVAPARETGKDAEWRPQLAAVQIADGWAMATDSYRLAAFPIDVEGDPWWLPGELIPWLPDDDCTVIVDDDGTVLRGGPAVPFDITQNGRWYPYGKPIDWLRLVTKPNQHRVTFRREWLLHAIRHPYRSEGMSLVAIGCANRALYVAGEKAYSCRQHYLDPEAITPDRAAAERPERDVAGYLDPFRKRCRVCRDVVVGDRDVCVVCRAVGVA